MLRSALRSPINTLSWLLLVAVFVATHGRANDADRRLWELRRAWGSVESLTWVLVDGPRAEVIDAALTGPFDLWDGDWWRVPLSALHHVNLLHLLLNLSFVVMCGPWLEERWGWWRYGLFLISSACVSMVPEYLVDQQAIGYSGVCCAILGALLALRRSDAVLQERMPTEWVVWMLGSLVAMVVLTAIDVVPVANGAHIAGLAYGWVTAVSVRLSQWPRWAFWLSHALLVLPYWCLVHPVWNGRYHWYQADMERRDDPRAEIDTNRLRTAVAWDPSLTGVWRILADEALREGELLEAWDLMLQGLQHNPSDQPQWQAARRLWRSLVTHDHRAAATQAVRDRFGSGADSWLAELRKIVPPPVLIAPDRPPEPTATVVERPVAVPAEWQPPHKENGWPNDLPAQGVLPAVNPTDASSAVEGMLL